MATDLRITSKLLDVLEVMLSDVSKPWWGFGIAQYTTLGTPTIYGILARLEAAGWIEGNFEPAEDAVGKPPRRLYTFTGEGRLRAEAALAARPTPRLRLSPKGRLA